MSAQKQLTSISAEEYLAGEEVSSIKHEWFRGEVFAMAGGGYNHTRICTNLSRFLENRLDGRPCDSHNSEQRIKVEATELYTYPDAVIFCPPSRFEGRDNSTLLTPKVLFEVLSQSTARYDRSTKWLNYQQIETLTDYVLVDQSTICVEHFHRTAAGWVHRVFIHRDEALRLESVGIELPLDEIYRKLELPEPLLRIEPSEDEGHGAP